MAELIIPAPSEKQRLFLLDEHKYVGYGGARGGGKSWAVRIKAVLLCYKYAGIKVMIIRRSYPELRENHIVPLCELLRTNADKEQRLASYTDQRKRSASQTVAEFFSDTAKTTGTACASRALRWTCCLWSRPRNRQRSAWTGSRPASVASTSFQSGFTTHATQAERDTAG